MYYFVANFTTLLHRFLVLDIIITVGICLFILNYVKTCYT